MPSNVENILYGILTGDGSGIQKPASRVEELLYAIYQNGGGGGGGGIPQWCGGGGGGVGILQWWRW